MEIDLDMFEDNVSNITDMSTLMGLIKIASSRMIDLGADHGMPGQVTLNGKDLRRRHVALACLQAIVNNYEKRMN